MDASVACILKKTLLIGTLVVSLSLSHGSIRSNCEKENRRCPFWLLFFTSPWHHHHRLLHNPIDVSGTPISRTREPSSLFLSASFLKRMFIVDVVFGGFPPFYTDIHPPRLVRFAARRWKSRGEKTLIQKRPSHKKREEKQRERAAAGFSICVWPTVTLLVLFERLVYHYLSNLSVWYIWYVWHRDTTTISTTLTLIVIRIIQDIRYSEAHTRVSCYWVIA